MVDALDGTSSTVCFSISSCTTERAADRAVRYMWQQSTRVSYECIRGSAAGVMEHDSLLVWHTAVATAALNSARSEKKEATEEYRSSRTFDAKDRWTKHEERISGE